MKHFRSFIFFIFSIAAMMLISCGDDDDGSVADDPAEQTEEEKQLESLSASVWTMSSITLDGADATSNFDGLVLTIKSDKTYSTNGSYDPVWPSSGSFTFGSDINTLTRDDGVSMTISVSETSLTITFTYADSGGRIDARPGDYVFSFTS
ncbi:MAG: hypothetical protein HOK17_02210 [Flammeovirgaceae bacterium]|nr:hypothetical protein [Flammeovirgaceae bacterium]